MDHHSIAHINAHMGYRPRAGIRPCEENNISRFCFRTRHNGTLIVNALRRGAGKIVDAGMGVNPAHKAAAIKAGRRAGAAPHIGVAQIFLRFSNQRGKGRVGKCLSRYLIMLALGGIGIDVVPKQVRLVSL